MQITIKQANASSHLVQVYQQDSNFTESSDDDILVSQTMYGDDEEAVIELEPGQYVRFDPVED